MAEYKSFVSEEGFAPAAVPDITPYIDENLEKLRQSEKQNIQDQFTVDKQRGVELSNSLKQLGDLSQTAGKFVFDREMEYRDRETAKIEQERYAEYIKNPEGFVDDLFEEQVAEVQELNKATEDLGGETYLRTGNHEVAKQVRELSGWREIRTARIDLALASQYYESYLGKQLLGNKSITDQKTRGAAIETARAAFMKQFQLDKGFSDDMLGTHLYPNQMKLHAKLMKEGAALDQQQDNFIEVTEATTLFEDNLDLASLVNTLANTYDENGKLLGRGRGFDKSIEHIGKMFKAGTLSAEQLEEIKGQEMPGMNGRTYGEMKGTQFENLTQKLASEERANNEALRAQNHEEAKLLVDDFTAKMRDPNSDYQPTTKDIEELQKRYRQLSGGKESSELQAFLKDTASAATVAEANVLFENLYLSGSLTVDAVMAIPSLKVRQKWLPLATQLENAQSAATKDQHQALGELVDTTPGLSSTVDGKRGFESVMIKVELKGEFNRRLSELVSSNPTGAATPELVQQALAETRALYEQGVNNPNSPYYFDTSNPKPGFKNYRKRLGSSATPDQATQARNRFTEATQSLQTYGVGALDRAGEILTLEDFQAMNKAIVKPGFVMPGLIKAVASETGLLPLEVIRRQREALIEETGVDLPALPIPPSLQSIENKLTPTAQALLFKYSSVDRSRRGLSQIREFDPSIVPNGYGPKIQESATKYNIPVGILTGLIEQESRFDPRAVSSAGAMGLGQFMPGTAEQMGVDPYNADSAIDGAGKYLRHLMDTYGFDLKTAIYAYNAGPGTIQKYGIGATEENKNYYPNIIRHASKYGYGVEALNDPAIMRPLFGSS